jgi:hypothetical protein
LGVLPVQITIAGYMSQLPQLKIQLTFRNLFVFVFFFFLMHELHELAHIVTGRIICGCWGTRDFNVWDLCNDCLKDKPIAILATFAGPVFTFAMLWLGRYWLLHGRSVERRSLGLIFILGNMQFGRMYMAATGSGDEIWGLNFLFQNQDHSNFQAIRFIGFVIVSIVCLPPLVAAYKAISNKRKMLLYTGFLITPLILDTVVILILLNGILEKGILNTVWIIGTPLLITIWVALYSVIVATNFRSLTRFAVTS